MNDQNKNTVILRYGWSELYLYFLELEIEANTLENLKVGQYRPIEDFSITPSELYQKFDHKPEPWDHGIILVLDINPGREFAEMQH